MCLFSIPLSLGLDTHSHVDDYSGTFGDVRKTKTKTESPLVVTLSQVKRTKTKLLVDWSVGGA